MTQEYTSPGIDEFIAFEPPPEPKKSWRRSFLEIVEILLLSMVLFLGIDAVSARIRVESVSMVPNLRPGYFVIVNKLAYVWSQPKRGDVIVFRQPQDSSQRYIKRAIGLPGDTVRIGGGEVYINGKLLHEPYLQVKTDRDGLWEVPQDAYFVMGDNRQNSSDSRSWGFVTAENVIGKALIVYWPPSEWAFIGGDPFVMAESSGVWLFFGFIEKPYVGRG